MIMEYVNRAHGVVGYHARLASCLREVLGSIPNVSILAIFGMIQGLLQALIVHVTLGIRSHFSAVL